MLTSTHSRQPISDALGDLRKGSRTERVIMRRGDFVEEHGHFHFVVCSVRKLKLDVHLFGRFDILEIKSLYFRFDVLGITRVLIDLYVGQNCGAEGTNCTARCLTVKRDGISFKKVNTNIICIFTKKYIYR